LYIGTAAILMPFTVVVSPFRIVCALGTFAAAAAGSTTFVAGERKLLMTW
jgi:hypothetical protein